jgi:TolA-binding protein
MSSNKQHNENLSREDIQSYLSTKDEQIKRVIEGKSLSNDFDSDALDGWSEQQVGASQMHRLDKKFKTSTNGWVGISIVSFMGITTSIFLLLNKPKEQQNLTVVNVEKTDIILPDSVDVLVELPKKELISVKEIKIKKYQKVKDKVIEVKQNKEVELLTVSELPILKPEFPVKTSKLKKVEAKEIYLNNLKLVDYRAYRKRPNLTIESLQLSGVPADKENKETALKENQLFDMEIAYHDYIDKTTGLLNKEDYKHALARLNIILSHYPDDLNALFYSGLCYYNLGEYSRSTEVFKLCLTSKFNNFDEEAEWMLAKSYEAIGETEKAKAIFLLIKERGGYYSGKL